MEENVVIGLVNTGSGVFFMVFCIPLLKRKIKMNDWYGFRFSKAFKSEENWYAINEYGARKLFTWSLFSIVTGLLAFFINFGKNDFIQMFWVVIPITLLTVIPAVQTINYAKKL
jgi:hypothetical protein